MNDIKELIKNDGKITVKELAINLDVSPETIRRRIKKMPEIKYIGSGYSGHWEIKE